MTWGCKPARLMSAGEAWHGCQANEVELLIAIGLSDCVTTTRGAPPVIDHMENRALLGIESEMVKIEANGILLPADSIDCRSLARANPTCSTAGGKPTATRTLCGSYFYCPHAMREQHRPPTHHAGTTILSRLPCGLMPSARDTLLKGVVW